jgi:hypothetical protein
MYGRILNLVGKTPKPFFPTDYFADYFKKHETEINLQSLTKIQDDFRISVIAMDALEDEYSKAIEDEVPSGLEIIYEKCEIAKSILKAEIENLEFSKQRTSAKSNLFVCYFSLIISIMALLWSSGLAWKWVQQVADYIIHYANKTIEENPEVMNPSISDLISLAGLAIAFCGLAIVILLDFVDYLRWQGRLRAKYKAAYQCFDIMQSAVLKKLRKTSE